jgi:hypothetical protein
VVVNISDDGGCGGAVVDSSDNGEVVIAVVVDSGCG